MNEVVILSGKGGTGKTTLSAAFATIGHRCVMADCDVDGADLYLILQPKDFKDEKFITGYKAVIDYSSCYNCGMCLDYCRFDAISFKDEQVVISETLCDGCKLCAKICPFQSIQMIPSDKSLSFMGHFRYGQMAHARLAPGEENSGKLVSVVRENARVLANEMGLNTIIIDGPPGTGCPVISSITGTNRAIIVTEPSNSGFHDLKRILQLTANFKVCSSVVINKYDLNSLISNKIEDWCNSEGVQVIGKIPFDEQIVSAMINCKSIIEWAPESDASHAIYSIYKSTFSY